MGLYENPMRKSPKTVLKRSRDRKPGGKGLPAKSLGLGRSSVPTAGPEGGIGQKREGPKAKGGFCPRRFGLAGFGFVPRGFGSAGFGFGPRGFGFGPRGFAS